MEIFYELFAGMLASSHHRFDRIVINGCLSGLSHPGLAVYFFHQIFKINCITK